MGLTGNTNEERIWNYLIGKGMSNAGTAGLMGNLYAESGLNPKNLQDTSEKKLDYTDDSYTAAVDNGSYRNFVRDSAGYGIAQWTYWSRKQNMLEFARAAGKSIGDLEMQLDFLFKELKEDYRSVLATLKAATTVKAASDSVLLNYERPEDQSDAVKKKRASYGKTYYDKYAKAVSKPGNGGNTTTGNELRQKVCNIINGWIGSVRGDAKHLDILNTYNNHKPLARGYKVQVGDSHCATTTSAAYIRAGIADYTGAECGVQKYVEIAQSNGIWTENDAYVPRIGDACVYDWDDNGVGDNKGNGDHIGIVTQVNGSSSFIVTEGNMSGGKVGQRRMQVNGKYIRGFITPDFDAIAKRIGGISNEVAAPDLAQSSTRTYITKKGDSLWAIAAKQLGNGSRYKEIKSLNGLTSNTIHTGQVLKLPN